MRTPRLAACVVAIGIAAVCSAQVPTAYVPLLTATPSHTPSLTPTYTPTGGGPTRTPTFTPTITPTVPTPKPTPWPIHGPEIGINATTPDSQVAPAVAIGADDSFVVAWTDYGHDGSGRGVFARRFSAAGVPLSGEFQVNTTTTGHQYDPAIASSSSGEFVVVWSSAPDFSGPDVFARLFDPAGAALGPEFMVNTFTTGVQSGPDVSADFAGNFVVVWHSVGLPPQDGDESGVYGQRFDPAGNPVGSEFLVNTTTSGQQAFPAIGQAPSGAFVVVWHGPGQPGQGNALFGQLFDGAGNPAGGEFPVSSSTLGDRAWPDVAWLDGSYGFVTVFERSLGGGSGSQDIAGRLFDGAANPFGADFQVNTNTLPTHRRPKVAAGPIGARPANFVVTWESLGQDDPTHPAQGGIFAQRYANRPFPTAGFFLANPPREGTEHQINTFTLGEQRRPDLAIDARGQFVIAWDSDGQDGSNYGVFARRFGFPDAKPARVDQNPSGGASDVDGVLEPGERVIFAPAWHNTTESALPLQGTLSNLTGASGPTYTIDDGTASYGSIGAGQTEDCVPTGDCYEVTVSGTRPSQHWDATADETLSSPGPLLGGAPPRVKTWALHVGNSFSDVPGDAFYPFIENIFHNRVTSGAGCGTASFCGNDAVLRQQMAVFVLKARIGADFVPPPATGAVFADVPASHPFAAWIEELARLGVTAGCAAPPPPALPSYCPASPVNRQQMAVFLLKTLYGSQFSGGGCSGLYEDVPCTNPFAPYIEYLTALNIAAGCQTSPHLYCPAAPTLRKQMAVFLVKTFQLSLYGPS